MNEVSGGKQEQRPTGRADQNHRGQAEQLPGKVVRLNRLVFNLPSLLVEMKLRQPGVTVIRDYQHVSHDSIRLANFVPHRVMGWADRYPSLYQRVYAQN